MTHPDTIKRLLAARRTLHPLERLNIDPHDEAAEGGCGVIGMACSQQIAGRHLLQSLEQMRNRGNGKGGGIAAVGLVPEEYGVSQETLEDDYLLAIAFLDPAVRTAVEKEYIHPIFQVDHVRVVPRIKDHTSLPGLDVQPPEVYQYFVRLKPEIVASFKADNKLADLALQRIEDEIVYQNSYRLNAAYYASTGEKQAFVLSHGKNMVVLKMVGFGDDVIRYYQLEDMHAHVWIGHHRYPTKGKVWHPGGAHPFVGLNEALVHNGDFANYASICEYLRQRNIFPLFLTDTEVSVLVFDLLHRLYDYPLEYVIESLAPTTERDFSLLPPEKRHIYDLLQTTHMHSSPDGPWFFLIAQSEQGRGKRSPGQNGNGARGSLAGPSHRLIGITDTSMLRPQVFAWQQASLDGPAIGFAASEKQAIDAALGSLAAEDVRFWSRADRYWNARGGSHTDGGAFIFSVYPDSGPAARLVCTDKFGREITADIKKIAFSRANGHGPLTQFPAGSAEHLEVAVTPADTAETLFVRFTAALPGWGGDEVQAFLDSLLETSTDKGGWLRGLDLLTRLIDHRYPTGHLRRSSLLAVYDHYLALHFAKIQVAPTQAFAFTGVPRSHPGPSTPEQAIIIDARGFDPEGENSLALELVRLVKLGFRHLIVTHAHGHRFIGNGMGANSAGVRIEVYGSSGDYLASGIDGAQITIHGSGQDQLAQIMKGGKLVVYGDVGQTFMYAAKGGEAYILGNAAGRPLINAVGKPRVVINGTCLDYLAESFMAGDPLNGGGFVILNGVTLDDDGKMLVLDTPYPGGNLFSLASGGAIYVRDPDQKLTDDQLNGGEFAPLRAEDWTLIRPYLEENERLFGIPLAGLLQVNGVGASPGQVYRKIRPKSVRALQAEEAWVSKGQ
jgi:glutamate synthase domain-containing protein 1/glutamate synthase domain-containing protein 3